MSYNQEITKNNLDDITRDSFMDALVLAFRDGITSEAPLGYSGDDIVLHGLTRPRKSLITVRNHTGMAELLITTAHGDFITLTKFNMKFGEEFISNQFYLIFKLVKDKVLS